MMQKTKILRQQYALRRANKEDWYPIFKDYVPDFIAYMELLFTKNKKTRKEFELIVADFYLRVDYWSDLFSAIITGTQLGTFGTISASELQPLVASQFADIDPELTLYSYLIDKSVLENIPVSIFENLRGDAGYEAAAFFYREYFIRDASDHEIILFWHLILNSVIRDYLDKTTRESITTSFIERRKFIEKNTRRLINAIKSQPELPDSLTIGKLKIPLPEHVQRDIPFYFQNEEMAKRKAEQILADATRNWIFEVPIQLPNGELNVFYASGVQYIANQVKVTKNKNLLSNGQSLVYARDWIKNFMNQRRFDTLLYEGEGYTPVSILLDRKPTKEYEIKTISKDTVDQFVRLYHSDFPKMNKLGFLYGLGAFDENGKMVGALALNTPAAKGRGYPGQYHIVEISRVVVPTEYKGEGISNMLVQWVLDNKDLFNRSQFEITNVITFSLIDQPATLYQSVQTLYPIGLVLPKSRVKGRKIGNAWKIRWESNPANMDDVEKWLPRLHPLFMKVIYGLNAYTGKAVSRIIHEVDVNRIPKTQKSLDTIRYLFRIPKRQFQLALPKPIKEMNPSQILPILLQLINAKTMRRLSHRGSSNREYISSDLLLLFRKMRDIVICLSLETGKSQDLADMVTAIRNAAKFTHKTVNRDLPRGNYTIAKQELIQSFQTKTFNRRLKQIQVYYSFPKTLETNFVFYLNEWEKIQSQLDQLTTLEKQFFMKTIHYFDHKLITILYRHQKLNPFLLSLEKGYSSFWTTGEPPLVYQQFVTKIKN